MRHVGQEDYPLLTCDRNAFRGNGYSGSLKQKLTASSAVLFLNDVTWRGCCLFCSSLSSRLILSRVFYGQMIG